MHSGIAKDTVMHTISVALSPHSTAPIIKRSRRAMRWPKMECLIYPPINSLNFIQSIGKEGNKIGFSESRFIPACSGNISS
jgi:hypothetical protein